MAVSDPASQDQKRKKRMFRTVGTPASASSEMPTRSALSPGAAMQPCQRARLMKLKGATPGRVRPGGTTEASTRDSVPHVPGTKLAAPTKCRAPTMQHIADPRQREALWPHSRTVTLSLAISVLGLVKDQKSARHAKPTSLPGDSTCEAGSQRAGETVPRLPLSSARHPSPLLLRFGFRLPHVWGQQE